MGTAIGGGGSASFGVHIDLETGGFETYAGQINTIDASTGALVATNKKATMSWKSMFGAMFLAQAAIATVSRGFQAIIGTVTDTATAFRDFENSMSEVSTILGRMDMELLPELEVGVESLSISFGKGANDIARGLYDILSAAVPAEDAMQLLYTSTKAAVAGLADVSTSVDVMTSVLNAYGKTVEQMVHVSDVMFQSIIRGKFRYEDLANALGYVTPIAAQVGVSFEELSAAMATATRHGQHIDMVSRGLALTMQNIIKPGAQAKKVAAEYGVELSLASLRAKGLVGFLEELNTKTGGNAAVISRIIPNMRSYRVAMVLAGEGIEGVSDDIELMSESVGKADTAFGKMAKTTQMAANIIEQTFEDINRTIGESTVQTDLFMRKLGMIKNLFMSNVFQGKILSKSIYDTSLQFLAVTKQIDKLVNTYTEDWQKQFEEAVDFEVPETLFSKLQSSPDLDLSQYEDAADKYLQSAELFSKEYAKFQAAKLKGDISPDVALFEEMRFKQWNNEIMDLYDAYAYWKSGVDDTESAIKDSSESIDIYLQKMSQLQENVGQVGVKYDGLLGTQLRVAEQEKLVGDMSHYISLALQEEQYQTEMVNKNFEWYNSELGNAITTVRQYENAQKKATSAQKEFNFALAQNQIAMMELQLIGMMRRRGLTRSEEKQMKALQIERTQINIQQAKDELEAKKSANEEFVDDTELAYQEAQSIIESFRRKHNHELWLMKENANTTIEELVNQINTEEAAYVNLAVSVEDAHSDMGSALTIYKNLVASYYGDEIPAEIQKSIDKFEELYEAQQRAMTKEMKQQSTSFKVAKEITKSKIESPEAPEEVHFTRGALRAAGLGSFQRGTRFVPADMYAKVHRGESIVPPGSNKSDSMSGGDTYVVDVHDNIIRDEADENRLAQKIASAQYKQLINRKTGKPNSRVR